MKPLPWAEWPNQPIESLVWFCVAPLRPPIHILQTLLWKVSEPNDLADITLIVNWVYSWDTGGMILILYITDRDVSMHSIIVSHWWWCCASKRLYPLYIGSKSSLQCLNCKLASLKGWHEVPLAWPASTPPLLKGKCGGKWISHMC